MVSSKLEESLNTLNQMSKGLETGAFSMKHISIVYHTSNYLSLEQMQRKCLSRDQD